ncbi:MAG: translation elongation factor Ts [Patescibacteria group bacterium]|jgi:elongation factor Ts
MEIKADLVKQLRDLTGSGMMEAKQALVEASGDYDKAVEILKARGASIAAKKAERVAANGVVASYIHAGSKIGVLVEVMVETDFVARDERFVAFARDLAVHIAGMNPKYVLEADVPADELSAQDDKQTYLKEAVLLNQSFVKDSSKTVEDLLNEQIAFFKENIKIGRFVRMELGSVG